MENIRKKSPRAPSITLDDALKRAIAAYGKGGTHPSPTQVMAQNLGYKSANNGRAMASMASLRYYGLLDRPREGMLSVSKAVEQYMHSANEDHRQGLLVVFLRTPDLFAELLDTYVERLPSEGTLRSELINRGFLPSAAETCAEVLRRSVAFVDYFNRRPADASEAGHVPLPQWEPSQSTDDRIPVRLTGGRRAWLIVPHRLYEADKLRLKAQIDLLLTEEGESGPLNANA